MHFCLFFCLQEGDGEMGVTSLSGPRASCRPGDLLSCWRWGSERTLSGLNDDSLTRTCIQSFSVARMRLIHTLAAQPSEETGLKGATDRNHRPDPLCLLSHTPHPQLIANFLYHVFPVFRDFSSMWRGSWTVNKLIDGIHFSPYWYFFYLAFCVCTFTVRKLWGSALGTQLNLYNLFWCFTGLILTLPPPPPVNYCFAARAGSCSECLQAGKGCTYCPDEVSAEYRLWENWILSVLGWITRSSTFLRKKCYFFFLSELKYMYMEQSVTHNRFKL